MYTNHAQSFTVTDTRIISMRNLFISGIFTLLILCIAPVVALGQTGSCPALVASAIDAAGVECKGLERNQVCYGNIRVGATSVTDASDFVFETPGNLVNAADVRSLDLSPMNTASGEWGIVVLNLQANYADDSPLDNVNMILIGDVSFDAAAGAAAAGIDVTVPGGINVRTGPGTNFDVVTALGAGNTVRADGRNAAADWVRVTLPTGDLGWLYAPLVSIAGDVSSLPVVEGNDPAPLVSSGGFTPLQAFTMEARVLDALCDEAPSSGILIQSPGGAGPADLFPNGTRLTLQGTVFLQGGAGTLIVNVLDGGAQVEADGVAVYLPAGTRANVPTDLGTYQAVDAPVGPNGYNELAVANLPIVNLPEVMTVAPGMANFDIVAAVVDALNGTWELIPNEQTYACSSGQEITFGSATPVTLDVSVLGGRNVLAGDLEFTATNTRGVFTNQNTDTLNITYSRTLALAAPDLMEIRVTYDFSVAVNEWNCNDVVTIVNRYNRMG
jgi:hypothetical protein